MRPPPWSWGPAWDELAAVVLISTAYAIAIRRYGADRPRVVAFTGSQLLVLAVFVTPIDTLALNYLLSAHLFQNVVLAEWAPALAVLGVSPALARSAGRYRIVRAITHPLVALPFWLVTYAVWHIPRIYDGALRHDALLHVEHANYFLAGLVFWWPVFQAEPHDVPSARKAAYVFAAFLLASPLGLLLALLPEPIYAFYEEAPRIWGLSALADQQIGGVVMAGTEAVVFFAVFAVFVLRFLGDEAGAPTRLR
jgi:cytochrome c oxidase assembly factor CtaG